MQRKTKFRKIEGKICSNYIPSKKSSSLKKKRQTGIHSQRRESYDHTVHMLYAWNTYATPCNNTYKLVDEKCTDKKQK